MLRFRIFLVAFNAALITFLVYRLVQVYRSNSKNKSWIMPLGLFLLLLPSTVLMGFIRMSVAYVIVYPVAIGLFLYFIKDE